MTTTLLQAFLWTESGPLTYDRGAEKWPRTQTLTPVHEVKPRRRLSYIGGVGTYGQKCNEVALTGYAGFDMR